MQHSRNDLSVKEVAQKYKVLIAQLKGELSEQRDKYLALIQQSSEKY